MKLTLQVPPPAPVFYPHVELDVRYFVVRGDGQAKIFDRLDSGYSGTQWDWMANHASRDNTLQHAIPVPIDAMTAFRLGLVTFEELQLPEAARAFLMIINPPH